MFVFISCSKQNLTPRWNGSFSNIR